MTELEPIFTTLLSQLQQILHTAYFEPDEMLLDEIRLKMRANHDLTLLKSLGGPIMAIVNSNETTMGQKSYAVKVMTALLPQYSFEDVLNTFGEEPILDAILMGRQHDLQKIVIQLFLRAKDPDATITTQVMEALFVAVSDPMVYYGVFDELHRVVVQLTKTSPKFRSELVHNRSINESLLKMKADGISQSRLTDLAIDLLPYVPELNKDLYLVSERELLSTNDPLLFAFTLQAYYKLLQNHLNDNLQFLENDMDDQFQYCSKLFVDDDFGAYIKHDTNADYPELLGQLSISFPSKFDELDSKYHLIEYALNNIKSKTSIRFLSNVDPMKLYPIDDFFENFSLSSETVSIFYNLVGNEKVFNDKLDVAHFPLNKFNLEFTKLLWVVSILTQHKYVIKRLLNEWLPIAMLIIKPKNQINDFDLQQMRKHIIEALLNSNVEMKQEVQKLLDEQAELARRGIYVMDPLTEAA